MHSSSPLASPSYSSGILDSSPPLGCASSSSGWGHERASSSSPSTSGSYISNQSAPAQKGVVPCVLGTGAVASSRTVGILEIECGLANSSCRKSLHPARTASHKCLGVSWMPERRSDWASKDQEEHHYTPFTEN